VDTDGVSHYPATNDSCYSFYTEIQAIMNDLGDMKLVYFFKMVIDTI
jgi:hypothetical protein